MKTRRPGRPPAFLYHEARPGLLFRRSAGSTLHCDEIPLPRLAERFGTPLYIYSASAIRERLNSFTHAFRKVMHTVCYSVKANSNLSVLRLMAKFGVGFDVVSVGELQRVLHVDRRAARKVVFSGVGKMQTEMLAALQAGILLFNVESEAELLLLAKCASRLRKTAPIALRVNPHVRADTHPYISTGLQQHKFGIPIPEARALYAYASRVKHLQVTGVSVHIGSQILDVRPFAAAMERVADLVRELRRDGHKIKYVDAGGGLGIDYENSSPSDFRDAVTDYATAVLRPLRGLKVHLLLEPGRCIVGPAGALLTRVLYQKVNGDKKFVVVDAAMNDLLRPLLYGAFHEIVPVVSKRAAEDEIVDIVGPVCETGDFFARERKLPSTPENGLLAILDAGAYGMTLASNYNSRPRPAEILVDGRSAKLIRRREILDDQLRLEE